MSDKDGSVHLLECITDEIMMNLMAEYCTSRDIARPFSSVFIKVQYIILIKLRIPLFGQMIHKSFWLFNRGTFTKPIVLCV